MDAPPTEVSDEALVIATRAGRDAAFAQLASRYKGRVLQMASRYGRNHHEIDDISQDIFIKAWKGLGKFSARMPFEHWFMRLAIRVCYDFLRRNRNRREREISTEVVSEDFSQPVMPHDTTPSERSELVHRALARLTEKERIVLTMVEMDELPLAKVAELTGWSLSNVKVRAFRARQSLKKILTQLMEAAQ